MNLSPLRLVPLHWKLSLVAALSPRRPPDGFPSQGPRLIVALAADYGNLGDVALTRALLRLAATHLPTHRPVLLPAGRIYGDLKGVALAADPSDVVAIVGGGNMGDLYPDLEEARVRVVRAFPGNRIISFPQSVDFSETPSGRRALARSRAAYENHPRLDIFARDAESLRRMRECFPGAHLALAPDTVFSLPAPPAAARDIPLLVCLRQDKEAGLSASRRNSLLLAMVRRWPEAVVTDTLVPGPRLDYQAYDNRLDGFLGQFARARCVVTDRLHGLIFSAISGAPCVAIENNNHKIRGVAESWLAGLSSVQLLANPDEAGLLRAIERTASAPGVRPSLDEAFAPLIRALRG